MWGIRADGGRWVVSLGILLAAAVAAILVHSVVIRVLTVLAKRTASQVDDLLIRHLRRPLRWVLVAAALYLMAESLNIPANLGKFLRHIVGVLLIAVVAWLLSEAASVLSEIILYAIRGISEPPLQRCVDPC
jgi:hypothetical protein